MKRISFYSILSVVCLIILTALFLPLKIFKGYPGTERTISTGSQSAPKVSLTHTVPESITVGDIFSPDHSRRLTNFSPDRLLTVIATGDVIPARSVNFATVKNADFTWPFKNITPLTRSGDLTIVNLETPLLSNCPLTQEGMIFCGNARHTEGLTFAGVDVVNLANNHIENHGREGIGETIRFLTQEGITVTGTGSAVVRNVKGTTIAFLGFDDVERKRILDTDAEEEAVKRKITEAKGIADLVIVSFSWGIEYTSRPSERQIHLAHISVDAGADLIIGNHPHWVQSVEIYKGKLITYAHGNTVFDQMWSEETKKGVIGKYTFYGNYLTDAEFFPIYIKNYGQPEIATGNLRDEILEKMKNESIKMTEGGY